MADNVIDKSLYGDGVKTHGMKGHVVPAAHEEKDGNKSGVHFDPHRPIAFTTIDNQDSKDDGDALVTKTSAATVEALAQSNKIAPLPLDPKKGTSILGGPGTTTKKGYVGFAEAEKMATSPVQRAKPVDYADGAQRVQPAVAPAAPPPTEEQQQALTLQLLSSAEPIIMPSQDPTPPLQPESEEGSPVRPMVNQKLDITKLARIKVKFSGSFGKLAVGYNLVFQEEQLLVMMQYSSEGLFYEPPGHCQESIEVVWANRLYICLPGVQFAMPDKRTHFTVMLIDQEATEERLNASKNRGG